jgi:hypothetical protein
MPITRTPIVDDDGSGTTGTVLDNAWKQELYNQIDGADVANGPRVVLVGHGNGTTTNPANENFSGYIGQGDGSLGVYDTLLVEVELHYTGGAMIPLSLYWVQSATLAIVNLASLGNPSGGVSISRTYLRRHGGFDYLMHTLAQGGGAGPSQVMAMPTIDGWSKAWALVMNQNGVPAGQALYWKWSVSKLAG